MSLVIDFVEASAPSTLLRSVTEERYEILRWPYFPQEKHTSGKASNFIRCKRPLTRSCDVRGFSRSTTTAIQAN
ncbi:hypothetical protein V6Z11_D06G155000 [Gossypium hirsutum]